MNKDMQIFLTQWLDGRKFQLVEIVVLIALSRQHILQ